MRRDAERKRLVLLENYQMQNSWLKWGLSDMMSKDLTWNKILTGYGDKLLKFVLNSNLQTMATPDNLKRWNIIKDAPCGLCTKVNVGLSHILAGCPWVLKVENKLPREDRNTWRHNCVLLELAGAIRRKISEVNASQKVVTRPPIRFVPAGKVPPRGVTRKDFGLLDLARDWSCDFHLPEFHKYSPYHIPLEVDISTLMCDGFIISRSKKIFIVLELSVPMEENIENRHQEKLKKYSKLVCPGWEVFLLIFEIGCRGFVVSLVRKLGFTPPETRKLRDNLQLVARRCSYIVWINRFNKDFNTTLRVSVDGVSITDEASLAVPLSAVVRDRITHNRESALLRLRARQNRRAALLKLTGKGVRYRVKGAATLPSPEASSPVSLFSSAHQLPSGSSIPTIDITLENKLVDRKSTLDRWTLLDMPGIHLKNSLNKCWFHAGLHLLSSIPLLRVLCTSPPIGLSRFENRFLAAILAIFRTRRPGSVSSFFPFVRDFTGINNRYGQVAVPDFIEHLCSHSPCLSPLVKFTFLSKVTCTKCKWISERSFKDISLKLHIPPGHSQVTLQDLVDYNSTVVLSNKDAVFCGHCNIKTPQLVSQSYNPDLFLLEVIRATESSPNSWKKNHASLDFSCTNLTLPGFPRSYRVVSSCHHRGALDGGHWITKISTNHGWFELDDLRSSHLPTSPPGNHDNSVVVVLVIAEDKL